MSNLSNKAIVSLAILKTNWDLKHKDYIDNYIPLFVNLIKEKKYDEICLNNLMIDFECEYGLSIPYHPTKAILNRLCKLHLVYRNNAKYYFSNPGDTFSDFDEIRNSKIREINKLIISFINFCKSKFDYDFSEESAESALISFYREGSLYLLPTDKDISVLPEGTAKKSEDYYICKFIAYVNSNEPVLFEYLTSLKIGSALATSILHSTDEKYSLSFKKLNIYLDTSIVLKILGFCSKEEEDAFLSLMSAIKSKGISIWIFEHTYDEVVKLMRSALNWKKRGDYTLSKANKLLLYFIENDLSETDIELKISRVQDSLSSQSIKLIPKPDYSQDTKFQIDEISLREEIVKEYKIDPYFDEFSKEESITKDIESIYSICKLRKGRAAFQIRDVEHVFITTNNVIARTSYIAEGAPFSEGSIPPCISDVLIGTMIWVSSPTLAKEINEKKLISEAFAAVKPDSRLIARFENELLKLKNDSKISENDYIAYRTNSIVYTQLSDKTFNDSKNLNSMTTQEIMNEIKDELKKEANNKIAEIQILNKDQQSKIDTLSEINQSSERKLSLLENKQNKIYDRIGSVVYYLVLVLEIIIIFSIMFFSRNNDLSWLIGSIFTSLGFIGFTFIKPAFKFKFAIIKKLKN